VKKVQGRDVSSEFVQNLKSSAVLKSKMKCRDFERNIYEKKSLAFDWKKVDEHFEDTKKDFQYFMLFAI
jgi:hypothetical protein